MPARNVIRVFFNIMLIHCIKLNMVWISLAMHRDSELSLVLSPEHSNLEAFLKRMFYIELLSFYRKEMRMFTYIH